MKQGKLILVTQDFSSLGFATLAKRQGDDVILAHKENPDDPLTSEERKTFDLTGKGMIGKIDLDEAVKTLTGQGNYWVFDQNYHSDYSKKLRDMGEKVFGAEPELMAKMEHDRAFGVEVAEESGFDIPPTEEFSDIESALGFLDANEENAYVFKPDNTDESHLTYVPNSEKDEDANRELYDYLISLKDVGTFILQRRIKGVEINIEAWLYQGEPFFAFCCLECKRKLDKDFGENTGCASDIAFTIPLESKGVRETIGKFFPFYEEKKYTGFVDCNVIIADKKVYFLEVCNRFGYNSHPNLFYTLAIDTFGNIMRDFMDGKVGDFYNRFRDGFGASVRVYLDHKRSGLPFHMKEEVEKHFYPYELYLQDDKHFLAGFSEDVGIMTAHGYTMEEAAEECYENIGKIHFPDKSCRSDLHKRDYPSSPIKRWEAMNAMGYFNVLKEDDSEKLESKMVSIAQVAIENYDKDKSEEAETLKRFEFEDDLRELKDEGFTLQEIIDNISRDPDIKDKQLVKELATSIWES